MDWADRKHAAGVVYPIMLRNLFTSIGFPWATRAMAFVMLSTNMIAIVLMRSRLPPRKMGPLIDFDAFKYIPWTLFVSGIYKQSMLIYKLDGITSQLTPQ